MKLSFGMQISKSPIKLSIGSIRKPTLADIDEIGFDTFSYYEYFLKLNPELYYEAGFGKDNNAQADPNDALFDLIVKDKTMQEIYTDVLNFFFVENVTFLDDIFIISNKSIYDDDFTKDDILGIIIKENIDEVLEIIQQICCIYSEEEKKEEVPKFKNGIAKEIYEKIQREQKKLVKKDDDGTYNLANIMSAINGRHKSLNYTNMWSLTIFQTFDTFEREITNCWFDISSRSLSIWGDEKKTFDPMLWCKNNYDKK